MKCILFDIDGTLIDSGGAGVRSLNLAFEELFSVRDAFRDVHMAGKTDLQIMREGLNLHGIAYSDNIIPDFFDAYVKYLKEHVHNGSGHVKHGIREALSALGSYDGYVLGLLTGNIEEGARIKLERFGLNAHFSVGAFGNDDEDRNKLLPLAVEKVNRQFGLAVECRDCAVIGDTPRDVECSKPYGALAIAVATGPYSFGALLDAGADIVLEDLSDTSRLLAILENGREQET